MKNVLLALFALMCWVQPLHADEDVLKEAVFAGGCFWCMQPPFDETEGVVQTKVGFAGGTEKDPTYKEVSWGQTSHTEVVWVQYNPQQVSYEKLLDVYWRSMDPTDSGGQFADRGSQYRPAIFYYDDEQRQAAEKSKADLQKEGPFKKPIVVPIQPATEFYPAEEYHQKYYLKSPKHYNAYKIGSGRAGFLKKHWK